MHKTQVFYFVLGKYCDIILEKYTKSNNNDILMNSNTFFGFFVRLVIVKSFFKVVKSTKYQFSLLK